MRVSFVLRVDREELARGRLVGEVEEVQTGRVGGLHGVEDLAEFCSSSVTGAPETRGEGSNK